MSNTCLTAAGHMTVPHQQRQLHIKLTKMSCNHLKQELWRTQGHPTLWIQTSWVAFYSKYIKMWKAVKCIYALFFCIDACLCAWVKAARMRPI